MDCIRPGCFLLVTILLVARGHAQRPPHENVNRLPAPVDPAITCPIYPPTAAVQAGEGSGDGDAAAPAQNAPVGKPVGGGGIDVTVGQTRYTFADATGGWSSVHDSQSKDGERDQEVLRAGYRRAEQQAARLAEQIRDLSDKTTAGVSEVETLKRQLVDAVQQAFELRQESHRAELAQFQQRLDQIAQQVSARDRHRERIIDRRVAELLNPELRWDSEASSPSSSARVSVREWSKASPERTSEQIGTQPPSPALETKKDGIAILGIVSVTMVTKDAEHAAEATGLIVSPEGHVVVPLPKQGLGDQATARLPDGDTVRATHVASDESIGLGLFRLNRDDVPVSKYPDGFYFTDLNQCLINHNDEAVVQAVYFDNDGDLTLSPFGHAMAALDETGASTGRLEGNVPLDEIHTGTLLNSLKGFVGMVIEIKRSTSAREEVWKRYPIEAVPASVIRDFVRRELTQTASDLNPDLSADIALDGYCPVALVDRETWVRGDPSFSLVHNGMRYCFESETSRNTFRAQPDRYVPVLDGCDVVIAKTESRLVPGDRRHGMVFQGRVFLFESEENLEKFAIRPHEFHTFACQANPVTQPRRRE